jgi:nitroimidazol reductase NimA-like FMN-containing flavoprotein (pyridoxamine 5'-phosphate oxidase superfamily)
MANITKEEVKLFLNDQYLMQLATVSGDQPGVSVMLYTIDDDLNFYFGTHADSYKIKNLKSNTKVSLVVWEFGKIQVQANGISETIESKEEQDRVLDKLADAATKDVNFWPPLFRIKGGEYTVIKIKPTWMRVLDLSNNNVRQDESPFTEIIL